MGKKRKSSKDRQIPTLPEGGVIFESHPDDAQLFAEAVEAFEKTGVVSKDFKEPQERPRPSKKVSTFSDVLDLHGCTLEEAQRQVDQFFRFHLQSLRSGASIKLRIVTGKGRHSAEMGSGVLAQDIPPYVQRYYGAYVQYMDTSPAEVALGGLPIRGHFDVVLRRR